LHVRQTAIDEINAPFYARMRAGAEALFKQQGGSLTEVEWQRLRATLGSPADHDWSVVDDKYYGYWGPAPAALCLPYVALAGVKASHRLASAILGMLTAFLTYLTLREAERLSLLPLNVAAAASVTLWFGLGTVHFA
jgi:hypothetical protein